jgi:hypothetical protein
MAIGDEGGGVADGGGLDLFGSFRGAAADASGNTSTAGGGSAAYSTDNFYGAFAFANARDIEYVKGIVLEAVFQAGGIVARDDTDLAGDVYVVIDQLGTHNWKHDFVVYSEENLAALLRLRAFYLSKEGEYTALGAGLKRYLYMANFVLGRIGPLNVNQHITEKPVTDPGLTE